MKTILCVVAVALAVATVPYAQFGAPNGVKTESEIALGQPSRGVVFKTAAINSDGSVATCFQCVSATRLALGQYQVVFNTNAQATNGWSRWVQPDTLSTGTTNAYCTTADRAGVPNGVWIECRNAAGLTDTSFYLFFAR